VVQVTYYSTRNIKQTRKNHRCFGCGQTIQSGQPAFYWAGDCDGEFFDAYYHVECRALEIAWNDLQDTWGDEFSSLEMLWSDREPEDEIWLEVEHPVAYTHLKGVSS
jgi:hypothetical protein